MYIKFFKILRKSRFSGRSLLLLECTSVLGNWGGPLLNFLTNRVDTYSRAINRINKVSYNQSSLYDLSGKRTALVTTSMVKFRLNWHSTCNYKLASLFRKRLRPLFRITNQSFPLFLAERQLGTMSKKAPHLRHEKCETLRSVYIGSVKYCAILRSKRSVWVCVFF